MIHTTNNQASYKKLYIIRTVTSTTRNDVAVIIIFYRSCLFTIPTHNSSVLTTLPHCITRLLDYITRYLNPQPPSPLPSLTMTPPHHPSSPPLLTTPPNHPSSPPLLTTPPHHPSSPPLLTTPPHHPSSPPLLTTPPHHSH